MGEEHFGFQKPQGIAYVESLNKVFVASGDDGMLRVFRGDTLGLLDSIKLDLVLAISKWTAILGSFFWTNPVRLCSSSFPLQAKFKSWIQRSARWCPRGR